MKTYLYKNIFPGALHLGQLFPKGFFTFLICSSSTLAIAGPGGSNTSNDLQFRNAKLESGVDGKDGAIYRFSQVNNDVDALVKITGRSSSQVKLVSIDITNTGWDNAFQ